MSDRLNELQRQRALLQGHLTWLDGEIARESGTPSPTPAPIVAAPLPAVSPGPQSELSPEAARAAEEIIARYKNESGSRPQDIKKGCYLYFALLMGLLVVFAVGTYFIYINLK